MELITLIRFFLLLLSFSLAACNSAYVKQDPQQVAPTHGLVMINLPREAGTLTFQSAKGKEFHLRHNKNSDFVSIWLPEGDYELSGIRTPLAPYKLEELYPKVKVRAGKITDMGSLVNFPVGQLKMVWLPIELPTGQAQVAKVAQELQAYIDPSDVIRWQVEQVPEPVKGRVGEGTGVLIQFLIEQEYLMMESDLQAELLKEKDISKFYELATRLLPPTWYFQPTTDELGNLYYGADLGYVKKRTTDAVWSTHVTGSQYPIIALHQQDGILYAGDDDGALFESRDQGDNWDKILQLDSHETIHDIDSVNDSLYIIADKFDKSKPMSSPKRATRIYEVKDGELLGAIKTFNYDGWNRRTIKADVYDNTYIIAIERDILAKLDISSGQWKDLKSPGLFNTFNLSQIDGTITLYSAYGMGAKPYVSTDMGQNWSKPKAPEWNIEDVYFYEPRKAVAHSYGAFDKLITLQEYDAKNNRWVTVTEAPDICRYLLIDADYRARFCVAENNYILAFDGNQWVMETIQ